MHPMLKPTLRRGWRSRSTLQFGVARAHAVVLGPVDTATGSFLALLDGTRGLPLLRAEARAMGLPDGKADALLERLTSAGLLEDSTSMAPTRRTTSEPSPTVAEERQPTAGDSGSVLDRLRADLGSLSLVHSEPGAGAKVMARRGESHVRVRGAGRVGAAVAGVLAAAGVGRVEVLDGGRVAPWDVAPGGVSADQVGDRREVAAQRVVRRSAARPRPRSPTTPTKCPAGVTEPALGLVIIAPRDGLAAYAPDPEVTQPLVTAGTPHLYTGVVEGTGLIGPLVLPGRTACAGCLSAHRTEREPAWSMLLAQWRSGRPTAAPSCDVALATVVAGLAGAHALAFLDGGLPSSVGARLELALPALSWHSEGITPHADCVCATARSATLSPSVVADPRGTMAK